MALQCDLKYILLDQKLNQTILAELTGLSRTTISLIANQRVKPELETALTIAEALEVPIERIWKRIQDE